MRTRPLSPFACTQCDKVLGFTAPGEAARMSSRAHAFCAECARATKPMTDRENEMIDVAEKVRKTKGSTPTYADIGEVMGVSTSRVQNLAQAIRGRGYGHSLHVALYGHAPVDFVDTPEGSPV